MSSCCLFPGATKVLVFARTFCTGIIARLRDTPELTETRSRRRCICLPSRDHYNCAARLDDAAVVRPPQLHPPPAPAPPPGWTPSLQLPKDSTICIAASKLSSYSFSYTPSPATASDTQKSIDMPFCNSSRIGGRAFVRHCFLEACANGHQFVARCSTPYCGRPYARP